MSSTSRSRFVARPRRLSRLRSGSRLMKPRTSTMSGRGRRRPRTSAARTTSPRIARSRSTSCFTSRRCGSTRQSARWPRSRRRSPTTRDSSTMTAARTSTRKTRSRRSISRCWWRTRRTWSGSASRNRRRARTTSASTRCSWTWRRSRRSGARASRPSVCAASRWPSAWEGARFRGPRRWRPRSRIGFAAPRRSGRSGSWTRSGRSESGRRRRTPRHTPPSRSRSSSRRRSRPSSRMPTDGWQTG
mmetsp:Transcript_54834/g.130190  ORF Transcript_54834/g.130190 Transcript_54834/m.130190 type:complete len:245 (-) Transcript_54834:349-1083(-)